MNIYYFACIYYVYFFKLAKCRFCFMYLFIGYFVIGIEPIYHLLYLASCNRVKYNLNLRAYDSVLQIFGAVAGNCVKITIKVTS